MGEIAEMVLDGTLCEGCGGYVGRAVGYPRQCRSCHPSKAPKQKNSANIGNQRRHQAGARK